MPGRGRNTPGSNGRELQPEGGHRTLRNNAAKEGQQEKKKNLATKGGHGGARIPTKLYPVLVIIKVARATSSFRRRELLREEEEWSVRK